jgi:hypothetical protein
MSSHLRLHWRYNLISRDILAVGCITARSDYPHCEWTWVWRTRRHFVRVKGDACREYGQSMNVTHKTRHGSLCDVCAGQSNGKGLPYSRRRSLYLTPIVVKRKTRWRHVQWTPHSIIYIYIYIYIHTQLLVSAGICLRQGRDGTREINWTDVAEGLFWYETPKKIKDKVSHVFN